MRGKVFPRPDRLLTVAARQDRAGAAGAFAVLVANIAMLLVGGTTTLLAQRMRRRSS